ncbi:FAD/NAD(P)-binding domain-containing protein [Cubamyces sp. BRFM 1775]|nr:FAD/NAD(P)-binding domain-containing protein [Cubamyces sp. BRFM 1775]
MSAPKVIIAGCGVAGPALGIILKLQGYNPIIYERTDGPSELGLSLCLQPNGLRVLSLIPGLVDHIPRKRLRQLAFYSMLPGHTRELARSDAPAALHALSGDQFGMEGVRRPLFLQALVDAAHSHGVPIHFGHQLVAVEGYEGADAERVVVRFANGHTDEASFVVGCDGLHSNTRACLFGKEAAMFTGLTQTGGISPIPEAFSALGPSMVNIYGDGVHMIAYQINEEQISWAITQREAEERETWRDMDADRQRAFKESAFSQIPFGGGELVKTASRIIKFGLYDRPELKSWHKGRVVLIGDAAHPTSPHLGQGANQASEDIYHLVRLLKKHNPDARAPSTALLDTVFTELEQLRIPRTSALVTKARAAGNMRVVSGADACLARDDAVRETWRGKEALLGEDNAELVKTLYADIFDQPFEAGRSEI